MRAADCASSAGSGDTHIENISPMSALQQMHDKQAVKRSEKVTRSTDVAHDVPVTNSI